MLDIVFVSTKPVGIITDKVGLKPKLIFDKFSELSATIELVVAELIRPDLLSPALNLSLISITIPGRKTKPESTPTEKVQV